MKHNRVHKLEKLAHIKHIELDKLAQTLQVTERAYQHELDQLDRLERYLHEYFYSPKEGSECLDPIQPQMLQLRGEFITQLQDSVKQQHALVDSMRERFDNAKMQWYKVKKITEAIESKATYLRQEQLAQVDKALDGQIQELIENLKRHH